MSGPPLGYDDESVVPQHRLKFLLGHFEEELIRVQSVFEEHIPGEVQTSSLESVEREFYDLRASADELGSEYAFLVERLISDYEYFRDTPDQEKLDKLFSDIKNLQLLLVG